jgi:hypothetical protein
MMEPFLFAGVARLHLQEFTQTFGLRAADWDFGLTLVRHLEHVAGFEPRQNFLDVIDVDEMRAMRTPK